MKLFLSEFEAQEKELVDLTVAELGSPIAFATTSQVGYQFVRTRSYIDLAPEVPLFEKLAASSVYREPMGVVGCITKKRRGSHRIYSCGGIGAFQAVKKYFFKNCFPRICWASRIDSTRR